jgi:hypothetical protein
VGLGLGPSPAIKLKAIRWLLANLLFRAGASEMSDEAASQLATKVAIRILEGVTRISPVMIADLNEAAVRVMLADA